MGATRHVNEIVQAITWAEINAYVEATGCPMRRWEKIEIRHLDDIALGVWRKTKTGDKDPVLVDTNDAEGVKALFARLAAAKNG